MFISILFKVIISYSLRLTIFDYLIVRYVANNIKVVCLSDVGLNVLILDIERFREDIKALCSTKRISIFSLDIGIQDK